MKLIFSKGGKNKKKNQMTTLQTGSLDPFRPIVLFMVGLFSVLFGPRKEFPTVIAIPVKSPVSASLCFPSQGCLTSSLTLPLM